MNELNLTPTEVRPAGRHPTDSYPTPAALCAAVVAGLPGWSPRTILEPSVGTGAWVDQLVTRWPDATYTTIDPWAEPATPPKNHQHHWCPFESFAAACRNNGQRFDLVIGNPPYRHAEEHVRLALSLLAPGGMLVFLLRLAFLASRGRYDFWLAAPPDRVQVLVERPSFSSDNKTDSSDYAVFTWVNGAGGHEAARRLDWLSWKERE